VLVLSLLGILKKQKEENHEEHINGLKLLEEAREISEQIGETFERYRWLIIPKMMLD
jgi:hypothetical protein